MYTHSGVRSRIWLFCQISLVNAHTNKQTKNNCIQLDKWGDQYLFIYLFYILFSTLIKVRVNIRDVIMHSDQDSMLALWFNSILDNGCMILFYSIHSIGFVKRFSLISNEENVLSFYFWITTMQNNAHFCLYKNKYIRNSYEQRFNIVNKMY